MNGNLQRLYIVRDAGLRLFAFAALLWTSLSATSGLAETLVIHARGGLLEDERVAAAIAQGADWIGLGRQHGLAIDRIVLRASGRDREIGDVDPSMARALLAESGHPDGLALVALFVPRHEAFVASAFRDLGRLGLDVSLRPVNAPREVVDSPRVTFPVVAVYTEALGPPSEAALPDLIVSHFEARYVPERGLAIRAEVTNIGGRASVGAMLVVREAEERLGTLQMPVPALPPRGTSDVLQLDMEVPEHLGGAVLEVLAFVVQDDRVEEATTRNNNAGPVRVRVPQPEPQEPVLPDLIVSAFDAWHEPGRGVVGTATVLNAGRGRSAGATLFVREMGGHLEAVEIRIPPLAPGSNSGERTFVIGVPDALAGSVVEMFADVLQERAFQEADRRNNASRLIAVELPELRRRFHDYEAVHLSGRVEDSGNALVLLLETINSGDGTAPRARVDLIVSDPALSQEPQWVGPLAPEAARIVAWRMQVPEELRGAELFFTAEIDPAADPADRRANNRSETIRIVLPPLQSPAPGPADLSITQFFAEPGARDRAEFEITVRNGGESPSRDARLSVTIAGTESRVVLPLPSLGSEEWRTLQGELPIDGIAGGIVRLVAETHPTGGDPTGHIARAEARMLLPSDGAAVSVPWVLAGIGLVLLLTLFGIGPRIRPPGRKAPKPARPPSIALVPARTSPVSQATWPPGGRRIAFSIDLVPRSDAPRWSVTREA